MSDSKKWNIDITGAGSDICQWITNKGGPAELSSLDIIHCFQAWSSQQQTSDVPFIPNTNQLIGTLQYWYARSHVGNEQQYIDQADLQTGCDF